MGMKEPTMEPVALKKKIKAQFGKLKELRGRIDREMRVFSEQYRLLTGKPLLNKGKSSRRSKPN